MAARAAARSGRLSPAPHAKGAWPMAIPFVYVRAQRLVS